jgi:hypothetical protein
MPKIILKPITQVAKPVLTPVTKVLPPIQKPVQPQPVVKPAPTPVFTPKPISTPIQPTSAHKLGVIEQLKSGHIVDLAPMNSAAAKSEKGPTVLDNLAKTTPAPASVQPKPMTMPKVFTPQPNAVVKPAPVNPNVVKQVNPVVMPKPVQQDNKPKFSQL